MIDSKFKVKKLLKIAGEIWFYSYSILIVYFIFIRKNVEIRSVLQCIFPISHSEYWFMTAYVVLYMLSNYINRFLKSLSQKEYILLMVILLVLWSVIPTVIVGKIEFSNLDWFILLYMIGAYIKIYKPRWINNQKGNIASLIILIFIAAISVWVLNKIYDLFEFNPLHFILPANQFINLAISVLIFAIFNNINIKNNKIINRISSCTLAVYLIHGQILARNVIWYDIYNVTSFTNSNYLVLYEIFVIITLYIACVLIELIRQNTVEKLYISSIEKLENKYKNKYKEKIDKMLLYKKEGGRI